MRGWSKAAGAGIGFYFGGPAGALLGYLIGKAVASRRSSDPARPPMKAYYEILEVPPTATSEEIRQSYRNLVKRYHPDLQGQVDERRSRLLGRKVARINEAYGRIRKARNF